MPGIKESKELLIAANEIAICLISKLKDGLQLGEDVAAIILKLQTDQEFKAKMDAGFTGVGEIKAELQDLSVSEIIDLASEQIQYVPKLIEAAKKEEA